MLGLGVYLTTAVKCGKTGSAVPTQTITSCSLLLEEELGLFPLARVLMLMGDVAIGPSTRSHGGTASPG